MDPVVLGVVTLAICAGFFAPYLIQGAALVLLADWRWGLELGLPACAVAAASCSALHAVLWRRLPEAAAVLGIVWNAIWIGAGTALGMSHAQEVGGPVAGIAVGVMFTLATNGVALMRWLAAGSAGRALEI
jgi:hypothetical protein